MGFIGVQPASVPLTASDIEADIINSTHIGDTAISGFTALAEAPADTDEFLISDGGVLKRIDASFVGGGDTPEDIVCWGFEISGSQNGSNFTVSAGKLMHGNTLISKTADTTLTFGTAGDWHDGATDSYSGGAGWSYVGVKSNGDVKLLGDNPAQKSDTSGNTAGYPYIYWHDGSNYWRVIGAVYVKTNNTLSFTIKTTGRRANRPLVTIAEDSQASYTSHSLASIAPKNILQLYGNIGNNGDGAGNSAQTYMNGTNDSGDVGASTNKADDANDSANKANLTDAQVSIYTDQVVYLRTANANTNYLAQCSGWELP